MEKVTNKHGVEIFYNVAESLMDDEIRENLHNKLAPCTEQNFFNAYEKEHLKKYGEAWVLSEKNPQY